MTTVRLRKAEVAELRAGRVPPSLIEKIDAKETRVPGLSARTAVEAFRRVLGNRLVLPPSGAAGAWGAMARRLSALALTEDDCSTIAKRAAAEWRSGPIRAESLVRQADVLLAGVGGEHPSSRAQSTGWQGAADLED